MPCLLFSLNLLKYHPLQTRNKTAAAGDPGLLVFKVMIMHEIIVKNY